MGKNKKILVFGAGNPQLLLIRACKELGYYTVVTDPQPQAVGASEADLFAVLSPKDLEGHRELIRLEGIQGIVTCQMENPLLLMAQLAEEFGFPFPSPQAIRQARNKFLMKQAFVAGGVPCAKGVLIRSREQLETEPFSEWAFPLIIKPLDSFSSRGVFRVENKAQILQYYPDAARYSSDGCVLIEEFLEGPEVSVESITFQGETQIVQITDKKITPYPYAVEIAHYQPSMLSNETQVAIRSIVKGAIEAIGIDNSGSHAEVKVTPQGVKMVEIGARLGGDYISSYLTKLSTGVDMNRAVAQVAMGALPDVMPSLHRHSGIQYVNWEPGSQVESLQPITPLLEYEEVAHAGFFIKQGQVLPKITESANRHAFIITSGENRLEFQKNMDRFSTELFQLAHVKPFAPKGKGINSK